MSNRTLSRPGTGGTRPASAVPYIPSPAVSPEDRPARIARSRRRECRTGRRRKVPYTTVEAAERELARLQAMPRDPGERLHYYRCGDCEQLHIGHLPRLVQDDELDELQALDLEALRYEIGDDEPDDDGAAWFSGLID